MPKDVEAIHTLNSRGHLMLEVYRDYFEVSAAHLRQEIQHHHAKTIAILKSKGIKYRDLRSALAPNNDKHEIALIFDSDEIDSTDYGEAVFRKLIPLLDPRTANSILSGDLLGGDQDFIFDVLEESLTLARSFVFKHSTLLYAVYINNISESRVISLHSELSGFSPYVGFIQTTYASRAKTYLSAVLTNLLVKYKNKVILPHEPDRPNIENVNITSYPFDEFGYKIVSLQENYFGIFLSYKIERPVREPFAVDTEIGLNAISSNIADLSEFEVVLDSAKHRYLLTNKFGKLSKAGLAALGAMELAALIKSKIAENYIYHLVYLAEHDVATFNLILEVPMDGRSPTRLTISLEYMPAKKTLRVITLY